MKHTLKHIFFALLLLITIHCTNNRGKEDVTVDFEATLPPEGNSENTDKSAVILRIQLKGAKSDLIKYGLTTSQQQLQRQEYYTLDFTSDIYLLNGTDTFPCIDSHMEQLYMDLPYRTFILNFGDHDVKAKDEIMIIDKVFSNNVVLVSVNNGSR